MDNFKPNEETTLMVSGKSWKNLMCLAHENLIRVPLKQRLESQKFLFLPEKM